MFHSSGGNITSEVDSTPNFHDLGVVDDAEAS